MTIKMMLAIFWLIACVACSAEPPMTPSPSCGDAGAQAAKASASVPGAYELGFVRSVRGILEPVTSLRLGQAELILGAHVYVEGHPELPAQAGSVTFEYCSLIGVPSNDPTRIDEAPLEACADGSAGWARLTSVAVNKAGKAFMNFGVVRYTPVIGFRFEYSGQRSGVLSGMSAEKNFHWN